MPDELEAAIELDMERFRRGDFPALEAEVAERRRAWLGDRGLTRSGSPWTPRRAYELFFRDYLGLPLDQVAVVAEEEDEIVWQSTNPCPTLEACKRLGLDTRKVCRAAYDKSTQAFFSALDPALRFHRSYTAIRPLAPHCEERIVRIDFEDLMGLAIDEARASRAEGNKGYGAVVLFGGEVVARAHDTAATRGDPSLHAEVNAIREACRARGDSDLTGAVLISSCEPCPMCSSLAVWAGVTSIVFGASIEETARLGKARILLPAEEVVSRSSSMIEVIGGVRREDCLALYS